MACRILVPRPGIEPMPPAVEAQSPNHWTAREVPVLRYFYEDAFLSAPYDIKNWKYTACMRGLVK